MKLLPGNILCANIPVTLVSMNAATYIIKFILIYDVNFTIMTGWREYSLKGSSEISVIDPLPFELIIFNMISIVLLPIFVTCQILTKMNETAANEIESAMRALYAILLVK